MTLEKHSAVIILVEYSYLGSKNNNLGLGKKLFMGQQVGQDVFLTIKRIRGKQLVYLE